MTDYEINAKGERISTRYTPGNFAMMCDCIRAARIHARYGDAEIARPTPHD